MATKQQVYCKKTSSRVLRKNHNGPINVSRCSKTDVSSENSDDCVYDNNHCGLVTRKKNRVVSRSRATSKKHHVSKVHVPSNCTNNYLSTNRCDEPCKSVASYKTKNGKIRRASCRSLKSKMLRGGSPPPAGVDPASVAAPAPVNNPSAPIDIRATLDKLRKELGAGVPDSLAAGIDSEFVKNALLKIQSETLTKVDPINELKNLDINNDGRVSLNDLLLLASFKLADTDFSGSLSLAEAEKGLTAMMNGRPANLTDKEFQTADISGDNSLDFKEYQLLYVFKSLGEIKDNEVVLSKDRLAEALKELGITSATESDIEMADMNKNNKIDFAEFLLVVAFKWADMNIDKTQIADSKLDNREAAMAFRLLGMEITPDEFNQADTDKSGALDFNEFTTFVAYKKVMKDKKIMDKPLLNKALEFLNLSSLANEQRDSKESLRAEAAKKGADQAEEERKAKEEKERSDAKRAAFKADSELLLDEKIKEAKWEAMGVSLKNHLAKLKVCDGVLLSNPDGIDIPSEKQKCLTKEQIKQRLEDLPKCDAAKNIVNPGTEIDLPFTQVCQQGGRIMISLNQFMNIVKSIRNNRLH